MPPRVGDIPRIKSQNPISLREVSRASAASGEKITLPEAPVGVPGFSRVAATNLAGSPVRDPLPRARNPKDHRFRCRVPESWPDSLSPSLRRSTATRLVQGKTTRHGPAISRELQATATCAQATHGYLTAVLAIAGATCSDFCHTSNTNRQAESQVRGAQVCQPRPRKRNSNAKVTLDRSAHPR
jgi:hypothetical protein